MAERNLRSEPAVEQRGDGVPAELVEASRRGDGEAFAAVVRLTYRRSYGLAYRLLRDRFEAEDVVQEAYLRMFRAMSGFREEARIETWMHRVVTNVAISRLRSRGAVRELVSETLPEPAVADAAESGVALREQLERALSLLPAGQRTAVVLKDIYGLSCKEIADALEIEEGAVKVRLHRARKRLRETIAEEDRADEM
jgi:RNA polymerase sigma-70 factor (ECF subfamily)